MGSRNRVCELSDRFLSLIFEGKYLTNINNRGHVQIDVSVSLISLISVTPLSFYLSILTKTG